jgi:hypothetical protein
MNDNIKAGGDIHAGDGGYSAGTKEKYNEFVKGRNQSLGKMRIKELAEQAGPNIVKEFDQEDIDFCEKFAELIVRECAEVIAPMGDWCGGHGEPSVPSTMECAKRLKKHFGVEG